MQVESVRVCVSVRGVYVWTCKRVCTTLNAVSPPDQLCLPNIGLIKQSQPGQTVVSTRRDRSFCSTIEPDNHQSRRLPLPSLRPKTIKTVLLRKHYLLKHTLGFIWDFFTIGSRDTPPPRYRTIVTRVAVL